MDKQKVFDIIKRRENIEDASQGEDYVGIGQVNEELIALIVSDIPGAIKFMCKDPDCDDNIFSWWSEVFDDVARKSQSREFVEALKVAAKRFPKACEEYSIMKCIEFAEDELLD